MKTQHDMEQEAAYYDGLERENKRLEAENDRLRETLEDTVNSFAEIVKDILEMESTALEVLEQVEK